MANSWQLWDRIRAYMRHGNVYRAENIAADQSNIEQIAQGGALSLTSSGTLIEQTNLQINRLERYKDYDQMCEMGEISLALDLYSDEGTLTDPETKHSLMIRSKYRRIRSELADLFYSTLLTDLNQRGWFRYLCKYGDCPLEIIPTKNRDGVASVRPLNVYNFSRVETRKGDLVGFFFHEETESEPTFLHPWQVVHMRLDTMENIFKPYGQCCDIESMVLTVDGYKRLGDIQSGTHILVWDGQKLVKSKVLAFASSGFKESFEIKTKHHTLRCSGDHPVLIREWSKEDFKFGDKWKSSLIYKKTCELRCGDEVIIPKPYREVEDILIPEVKNGRIDLHLPKFVDVDFARFFGFMIGDGWFLTAYDKLKGISFALGVDQSINDRYIALMAHYGMECRFVKRKTGKISKLPYDQCLVSSIDFAEIMAEMGFSSGAKVKRIPGWVYRCSDDIKKAFIEGLIDADGSLFVDKWGCERYQIELANQRLIKDTKFLLHDIGWKCGKIIKRKMGNRGFDYDGKKSLSSQSWLIYFFKSDTYKNAGTNSAYRGDSRKKECEKYGTHVIFEPIKDIKPIGAIETADIQVENFSNFIADGIVVHNSILQAARKDFKRLRLMEDAALIYRISRAPMKRVFKIPVGNIPTEQIRYFLDQMARTIKKRRIYNPATGQIDERWSPLIQEDDYFLPRRPDGSGPEVDTLPGAENLDQIADIEYFKKKMVASLKIPFSRVGIGESGEDSRQSLSQVAPEFAKAVQWIQRVQALGLQKVALVHLALKGYTLEEMKSFELYLPASSAIDALYRIERWATAADVMATLKDIGYFTPEFIVRTFTDLSEDEVKKQIAEVNGMGAGGLPAAPALGELGGPPIGPVGPEPKLEGFDYGLESKIISESADILKHRAAVDAGEIPEAIENRVLPNISTFINLNEMNGLPSKKEGKLLVEDVEQNVMKEARSRVQNEYVEERDAMRKREELEAKLLQLSNAIEDESDNEVRTNDLPS